MYIRVMMREMISYFYFTIQIHMSIINVHGVFTVSLEFVHKHLNKIKSFTFEQFMQYVDKHYNTIEFDYGPYKGNNMLLCPLSNYITEDVITFSNNNSYDVRTNLWYSLCRMLFIESFKYLNCIHKVSITNVVYNNIFYNKFIFINKRLGVYDNHELNLTCKGIRSTRFDIKCENTSNDREIDSNVEFVTDESDSECDECDVTIDSTNVVDIYNTLSDIEQYIVDNMLKFRIGIHWNNIPFNTNELHEQFRKYCYETHITYKEYEQYMHKHPETFDNSYIIYHKLYSSVYESMWTLKPIPECPRNKLLMNVARYIPQNKYPIKHY